MNRKKLFSFPSNKKTRKKLLDELQQTNGPINADEVTGGRDSTSDKPIFDWFRQELGGEKPVS